MRGLSDIVSYLILLTLTAALAFAFGLVAIGYFKSYSEVASELHVGTLECRTTASLSKVRMPNGTYVLVLAIHDTLNEPVDVHYVMRCRTGGGDVLVANSTVTIPPKGTVFEEAVIGKDVGKGVCYAIIVEPHLVTYKVVESS